MPKRNNPEARLQAELISRLNEWGTFPLFSDFMKWVHHIPNGGHRSKGSAIEMKAIGLKPGVHDLCCPWPTSYSGMATIEMKAGKGATSDGQDEYTKFMEKVGNISLTTNSVTEAERFIIKYMIDSPFFENYETVDVPDYYFDTGVVDKYTQQKHSIMVKEKV